MHEKPQTVPKRAPDYSSRAYWNGTIKMSLSKFFILRVLHDRPMHGYDVARAVERMTNGCCSPSEGTIYPVLRDFEDGGYVTCERACVGGRERKVYSLTRSGREALRVAIQAWMKITDALADAERADGAPFELRCATAAGERRILARAVVDASGTWRQPNPIGVDGLAVPGEAEASGRIAYGIPDVLGAPRADYGNARVLVVGGGHSAVNVVLDLMRLKDAAPKTRIFWALRRDGPARLAGGGGSDRLPGRGALGKAAMAAAASGRLEVLAPAGVERIERTGNALRVRIRLAGQEQTFEVDRIIVATGFRPDLSLFGELRVALDPAVEAPPALAPLIDPNLHSCGTVPPHGEAELAHPEPGFYIAGSKSYGRAPTFLMATGYEQVRSIAAALAGDFDAARDLRLVLPETGVCITDAAPDTAEGCCGGPAPAGLAACCLADAEAKSDGRFGCGCQPEPDSTAADAGR